VKRGTITNRQLNALVTVAWAMHHFGGGLRTGKRVRRQTMLRLMALGLVEETDPLPPCDGDGFLIEGRVAKRAWRLTRSGWNAAQCFDRDGTREYYVSVERILADEADAAEVAQ